MESVPGSLVPGNVSPQCRTARIPCEHRLPREVVPVLPDARLASAHSGLTHVLGLFAEAATAADEWLDNHPEGCPFDVWASGTIKASGYHRAVENLYAMKTVAASLAHDARLELPNPGFAAYQAMNAAIAAGVDLEESKAASDEVEIDWDATDAEGGAS